MMTSMVLARACRLTNCVGLKTLLKTIEMAVDVPEMGETKQGTIVLIVHPHITSVLNGPEIWAPGLPTLGPHVMRTSV